VEGERKPLHTFDKWKARSHYIETMKDLLEAIKADVEEWILDLEQKRESGLEYARSTLRESYDYTGFISIRPPGLRERLFWSQSTVTMEWNCSPEWCVVEAVIPVPEIGSDYPERKREMVVIEDKEGWLTNRCHVFDVVEWRGKGETDVNLLCVVNPNGLKKMLKELLRVAAERKIRFRD